MLYRGLLVHEGSPQRRDTTSTIPGSLCLWLVLKKKGWGVSSEGGGANKKGEKRVTVGFDGKTTLESQ